jgi:hypothetical protein
MKEEKWEELRTALKKNDELQMQLKDANKKLIEEIKQKMEFDFNNQTSDWHEYGYLFVSKTDWEKFWEKLKGDLG